MAIRDEIHDRFQDNLESRTEIGWNYARPVQERTGTPFRFKTPMSLRAAVVLSSRYSRRPVAKSGRMEVTFGESRTSFTSEIPTFRPEARVKDFGYTALGRSLSTSTVSQ